MMDAGNIGWLSLTILVSEWAIRLLMLPTVARRHNPTTATAWLLVIFLQPFVGIVLYSIFGAHRLPRRRIQRQLARLGSSRQSRESTALAAHIVRPRLDERMLPLVVLAARLGEMPILGGNDAEIIIDTRDFLDRLITDIDEAKSHVHLQSYIYGDDETGERVADALARAVERGVPCRVLIDAVGSWRFFRGLGRRMVQRGIQLHRMLPVGFIRKRFARIDLRNHRKLMIIDGRAAYTGSQNVVNPNYGHKNLLWRDLMVRVTGPAVLQLQQVFVEDWYTETGELLVEETVFPPAQVTGNMLIQTLPSGPVYPIANYHELVVAALYGAEKRVIITSPYLVPDDALLRAMRVAILRGALVDLVVPSRSDQIFVGAVGRAYYDTLLKIGARLFLYQDGLLHAKSMTIDDSFALIGTGNFDIRSFFLNFELNLLAYGPHLAERLRLVQEHYIARSTPLALDAWRSRSRLARAFDDVTKLLSPIM